jgi:hypothetical protein
MTDIYQDEPVVITKPVKEKWFYVMLAITLEDAQDIRDRIIELHQNPESASDKAREVAFMIKQAAQNRWSVTYQGQNYKVIWGAFKGYIKDILERHYPDTIVVGAFNYNGLQVGQKYDRTREISGDPKYAWNPNTFNIFPDIPIYDEDGNQTGTRPMTGRDVPLFCGQTRPLVWQT